jgi:hypothetical protein
MTNKILTIVEVCPEFDCDYRVIHELETDGYITNNVVVKSPTNQLMYYHAMNFHLVRAEER